MASCPPRAARCSFPARSNTRSTPRTSNRAAACWRGSSGNGPAPAPGPCWGCAVVPRAGVPAGSQRGCSAPGAGEGNSAAFAGCRLFAAAAVLICGFAAGTSAGGLARWYMSAAVLLGALSWRAGAARRTPGGVNAGGAAAQPAARSPQNAAAAAVGSAPHRPARCAKAANCKKSRKTQNSAENSCKSRR